MASSELVRELHRIRTLGARAASTRLDELLIELAEAGPRPVNRDTTALAHVLFALLRLRNAIQQRGSQLETNARWDEALTSARLFERTLADKTSACSCHQPDFYGPAVIWLDGLSGQN